MSFLGNEASETLTSFFYCYKFIAIYCFYCYCSESRRAASINQWHSIYRLCRQSEQFVILLTCQRYVILPFCGEYENKDGDGGKTIFLSLSRDVPSPIRLSSLVFSRTTKSSRDDNYCLYRNSEGEVIIETTLCSTRIIPYTCTSSSPQYTLVCVS